MMRVEHECFDAIAESQQTGVDLNSFHPVDPGHFRLLNLLAAGQVHHVQRAAEHAVGVMRVDLVHVHDDDGVGAGGVFVHLGLGLLLPPLADCQDGQEVRQVVYGHLSRAFEDVIPDVDIFTCGQVGDSLVVNL